ncbi:MAG TPA: 7-carboxy-7-deazaguanine synthase QueE [Allosphingosinicella sp.]|nr:7-carboxy-7-deazaguanine synthase QueE [Allosphingosinicella sp.]
MDEILKVACKSPGVPEIFRSIQGEGRNSGRPRTFLRLSGCNLQCHWCDTPYTWNWEGTDWPHSDDRPGAPAKYSQEAETLALTFEDLATRVLELPAEGLVVTGGEPLVQMTALTRFIRHLKAQAPDLLIEIETNGTIAPDAELTTQVDLFMVSPKLENSANRPGSALRPAALQAFAKLPTAHFKFVAATPQDVERVAAIASEFAIPAERIYIMPLGTSSERLIRTGALLIDSVLSHGFNYSDRLHIHLFGDSRGT